MDLVTIPKKIKKFLTAHTRKGKVDKLSDLTQALTQNTRLVVQKYEDLKIVEVKVAETLGELSKENFAEENLEIDALKLLPKEERVKFKTALVAIKNTGITELTPISTTAQRIKAHMLITLNKAQVQKAVLMAKSQLAGNVSLQLDTLKIVAKQTKDVNLELEDLLIELDKINEGALNTISEFKKHNADGTTDDTQHVISNIFNKLSITKK